MTESQFEQRHNTFMRDFEITHIERALEGIKIALGLYDAFKSSELETEMVYYQPQINFYQRRLAELKNLKDLYSKIERAHSTGETVGLNKEELATYQEGSK